MCLSSAYMGERPEAENLIAEYITSVEIDGDTIRMLDVTGEETTVFGALSLVDFIGNKIYIKK